ncbi:MAG: hypothetical protein R2932_36770 [Caldilineaceae bacterium]
MLTWCSAITLGHVFAAHIHWAFYNQIAATRFQTVPSVAFTRPGFSELFSSAPPAEQGRDDVEKLGFFLVRIHENDSRVHFIRTSGQTDTPAATRLVTGTTADLPASPLGLTALHPIASTGQVPMAWPSTIRQTVRNDYGLLNLLELGVRQLRVPATDLQDPGQRERLAILRSHGVALTAQWLWAPGLPLTDAVTAQRDQIDGVEVQLLGAFQPPTALLTELQRCGARHTLPVALSCVVPGQNVPGKQHGRSQIGYTIGQLPELNQALASAGVRLDRVCCRLDTPNPLAPWAQLASQNLEPLPQIGAIDWLYTVPVGEPISQVNGATAALFSVAQRPGDRLFIEPYVDFDRTMDAGPGLLDRRYNPRSTFHGLRHLNTLLYHRFISNVTPITVSETAQASALTLRMDGRTYTLMLPASAADLVVSVAHQFDSELRHQQQVGLLSGHCRTWTANSEATITEPTLFCSRIGESSQGSHTTPAA